MSKVFKVGQEQPAYRTLSSIVVDYEQAPGKGQKVFSLKRNKGGQLVSVREDKRQTKTNTSQAETKASTPMSRAMTAEIDIELRRRAEAVEREAYEQGFAQGEKAGREIGEQKLAVAMRNVEQMLETMGSLKEELFQREEKKLIGLAYLIAEKVVHFTIEKDEEVALKIAEQVLLKTMREDQLRIELNPQDESMFRDRGSSLPVIAQRLKNLTIETNESVQRGGCIVSTPMGEIDATIDNQLYMVKGELMEEND